MFLLKTERGKPKDRGGGGLIRASLERQKEIAKGIPAGCWGDKVTPVSLGYPLTVFNQNSTLKLEEEKCVFQHGSK